MARQTRDTLKAFFRTGSLPQGEQFADLIDSTLNMNDEGFDKSPELGFQISSLGDHDALISFCTSDSGSLTPRWQVLYGENRTLDFTAAEPEGQAEEVGPQPILTLAPSGKIGVNRREPPAWQLDVRGVIRAEGRIGVSLTGENSVPADGDWHRITGALHGCNAFEVVAGAGRKKTGKYALMHALALNTFHPRGLLFNFLNLKRRIRYQQAYYRSRSDKLKLRWKAADDSYFLELKSNRSYGDEAEPTQIRYSITRLWFDEMMTGENLDVPIAKSGAD